jgi:type IV secretion system protein VirB9
MKKFKFFPLFCAFLFFASISHCMQQEAKSIAITDHIKEINYNPNGIHRYTGFFGYQSSILFEDGEVIGTISMGNSTGWQLDPQGNRLFLKPIEDNPETNVTILTNKRVYHFVFYGKEAKGLDDPELAYEVRFQYPADNIEYSGLLESQNNRENSVDVGSMPHLNFNYRISGKDYMKPIKIFDDGKFTYMQFKELNADLPAIFLVDLEGYESLINYHISGSYVVIERVAARFTLRHGEDYVCVFNDNIKYVKQVKKRGVFGARR